MPFVGQVANLRPIANRPANTSKTGRFTAINLSAEGSSVAPNNLLSWFKPAPKDY